MKPVLSIIVPLYNEEQNIDALFQRLQQVEKQLSNFDFEFIFVDDGSGDNTKQVSAKLSQQHSNVRTLSLSPNCGSHVAIMTGLKAASGHAVMFIAGDLQDPPELINEMLQNWQKGYKIVWAARKQIQGVHAQDRSFSHLYWLIVKAFSGVELPSSGVDFALMDSGVVQSMAERWSYHTPIFQLIAEVGVPSTIIFYDKAPRHAGKSGWTLKKKLALVAKTLIYAVKPAWQVHRALIKDPAYTVDELCLPAAKPII